MRLMEAIVAANHAAAAGRPSEVGAEVSAESLPLAILTCIDSRLNKLVPGALGLTDEQFVWLRNAGNVITSPLSSTVRSMAIAIYLKGAKEIAVIGHTDCRMAKLSMSELLDRLKKSSIERHALPIANLHEFFGLFTSEKTNVLKAVGFLRASPIIPAKMPVHGLIIDTTTGKFEWTVNGYETQHRALDVIGTVEEALAGYVAGPLRSLAAQKPHVPPS